MFMKKRHITLLICLLTLSLTLLSGCGNQGNTPAPEDNKTSDQNMTTPAPEDDSKEAADNGTDTTDDVNKATGDLADNTALSERADKIAKAIVDGVEDVEDAHVVISEHIAYAAVKIKADDAKGEAEAVKEAIIKTAKEADSDLTDVYVSESPDVFTRLQEMGTDIGEGKPISGFVEELENLFTRVTPSK